MLQSLIMCHYRLPMRAAGLLLRDQLVRGHRKQKRDFSGAQHRSRAVLRR